MNEHKLKIRVLSEVISLTQSELESEVSCFASLYSPGSAISDVEAQEHYDRFFEVCIFSKN